MKTEKTDRRVKYTKMVLREALLTIMKKKPVAKITPTELCREADVNRNTFYAHYMSPIDLLNEIEDELYGEIMGCVSLYSEGRLILDDLCKALKDHGSLCKLILSEYGDRDFLLKIIASARDIVVTDLKKLAPEIDDKILNKYFTYCANGSVSIIYDWVNEGMKESHYEIASILENATNAVMGFLVRTKGQYKIQK